MASSNRAEPRRNRPAGLFGEDGDRAFLASLTDHSEDAIVAKSLTGEVLSWNKAAERLFGFRRREMVGQPITRIIPPEHLSEERSILSRLCRGKHVEHYETVRLRKDGRRIDVSISVSPIRDAGGRIVGAFKVARDITHQKQTQEALRRGEQLMRAILDTAADAIITIDHRGEIRSVNAATEHLFGYGSAELVGQNINRLMPEPYRGEHDGYLRRYCRTGQARIIGIGREVTGQRKDGSVFPMHLSVSEVRLKDQRLFTGIVHDLTERRRLEREIMEAAANEQRRIGHDLHDGLCQDLIGIAFGIDAAGRRAPAEDKEAMAKLAAAVRDAAGQARRLAHGLNPVDLKAGGLAVALENLAAKVSETFGVRCGFHWDHVAQARQDATAAHLYRIAQEAVGNAIRHGKAKEVQITLVERGAALVLTIADNGKGMPESVIDSVKQGLAPSGRNKASAAGMGLQTMHYRARIIGGTLSVASGKGKGARLTCVISREQPLQSSLDSDAASGDLPRRKRGRRGKPL